MSRIAKKPIVIPAKVEAKSDDGLFSVKGPLGELKRQFRNEIEIGVADGHINVVLKKENPETKILLGTYASHVKNMLEGVTLGFKKNMIIEGVGYKVRVEGKKMILNIGLSHPVELAIPEGLKVETEKSSIVVSGIDKEAVAKIRALKKPEPYKGKGIRYENEVIRRKAGKKTATAG
jgi:large subunit ribosomal protein L6